MAVVTCLAPDGPRGLTVSSVCSVSLDPPLVLVCLDNAARTLDLVRSQRRFGINVLHGSQHDLSRVFASKVPEQRKFDDVRWSELAGVPVIDDAHAWLGCDVELELAAGDHTIVLGEVRSMDVGTGEPLVFYRGGYHRLAEATC